jgi:hypothetical protein
MVSCAARYVSSLCLSLAHARTHANARKPGEQPVIQRFGICAKLRISRSGRGGSSVALTLHAASHSPEQLTLLPCTKHHHMHSPFHLSLPASTSGPYLLPSCALPPSPVSSRALPRRHLIIPNAKGGVKKVLLLVGDAEGFGDFLSFAGLPSALPKGVGPYTITSFGARHCPPPPALKEEERGAEGGAAEGDEGSRRADGEGGGEGGRSKERAWRDRGGRGCAASRFRAFRVQRLGFTVWSSVFTV